VWIDLLDGIPRPIQSPGRPPFFERSLGGRLIRRSVRECEEVQDPSQSALLRWRERCKPWRVAIWGAQCGNQELSDGAPYGQVLQRVFDKSWQVVVQRGRVKIANAPKVAFKVGIGRLIQGCVISRRFLVVVAQSVARP
jgi:hypothetical protein